MLPQPPPETPNLDEVIDVAQGLDPEDRLRLIATLWSSLPPSQLENLDEDGLADLRRRLQAHQITRTKVYSVPRRFDLATIFVVTLAFSLLFGAMKALSFPAGVSASIAGFIFVIGAGQAFLFGGRQPRTASIVTGAIVYSGILLVAWLYTGQRFYSAQFIFFGATSGIIGGGILGYLSGVFIGGVFLIADKVRKFFFPHPRSAGSSEE